MVYFFKCKCTRLLTGAMFTLYWKILISQCWHISLSRWEAGSPRLPLSTCFLLSCANWAWQTLGQKYTLHSVDKSSKKDSLGVFWATGYAWQDWEPSSGRRLSWRAISSHQSSTCRWLDHLCTGWVHVWVPHPDGALSSLCSAPSLPPHIP